MRRRLTLLVLVLLAVALCGSAWAVPIAPGLDVTAALDPSSGGLDTEVRRILTITNTNVSGAPTIIELGPIAAVVDGVPVPIQLRFTIPGAEGARQVALSMPLPEYTTFVPGSLIVKGVVQPDPEIVGNAYSLTVTVPAAVSETKPGVCLLQDRVHVLVTTPVAAAPAPLSMALKTTDEGDWRVGMKFVRERPDCLMSSRWLWWQSFSPPIYNTNVVMRASVPPGVTYRPSAGAYRRGNPFDLVPGEYANRVVTWRLGDFGPGEPFHASWFMERDAGE